MRYEIIKVFKDLEQEIIASFEYVIDADYFVISKRKEDNKNNYWIYDTKENQILCDL